MTDSDSELMLRFAGGDDDAFRQLAARHQRPLVNFFYRLTRDRFTAEDYTQEVFARIIRAKARYRRMAKFRTWMYRIAKNYWIDRCRERAAAPNMGSLSTPIREDEGGSRTLADTVEGESPRPADEVRRQEIGKAIKAAVSRLPEEQRLVFVLSENQGMKYAEISEVMEIPVGTVKSRMHAAVRRLRELLKDVYDGA
ncbi:MAG: sigma-70 family RNA polymerase sigma factor [Planctomycetota bacterium]